MDGCCRPEKLLLEMKPHLRRKILSDIVAELPDILVKSLDVKLYNNKTRSARQTWDICLVSTDTTFVY